MEVPLVCKFRIHLDLLSCQHSTNDSLSVMKSATGNISKLGLYSVTLLDNPLDKGTQNRASAGISIACCILPLRVCRRVSQETSRRYVPNLYSAVYSWDRLCDQSFWLQIQMSGFDSRGYQIFWEVVGLERGPLSLVSAIEELFERKKQRLRSRNPRIRP
jgi:hypothetical protein